MNTIVKTDNNFSSIIFTFYHAYYSLCFFFDEVIRLLWEGLQHILHWFVCMFHLLAKIYGKTVGPRGFSGRIRELLGSCENSAIVKFQTISKLNLDIESPDQNTDQMFLYQMSCSVSTYLVEKCKRFLQTSILVIWVMPVGWQPLLRY